MKSRNGFISNSSSTSFIIDTQLIENETVFDKLFDMLDEYKVYIRPSYQNIGQIYVVTGSSDDDTSVITWWKIRKYLVDNNIHFVSESGGTPTDDQKTFDFITYFVNIDDELNDRRVKEFKDWLHNNIDSSSLNELSESIGITKEEILRDLKDIHNPYYSECIEMVGVTI